MEEVVASRLLGATLVEVVVGDLTLQAVDAIVNAANSALAHGGGVAGAIVRRGGEIIQRESRRVAPVAVGGAAVTGAGALPCRYVIHAVGPMWGEGDEERTLAAAVASALDRARELGLASLALPAISTGIFGVPKQLGCRVIVAELHRQLQGGDPVLAVIRLVSLDEATAEAFAAALAAV